MTIALQGNASIACDEHELVAAVRRGDDRAFEVLFSCYERRITGYVAGMVGDHARAEDITQDVFISALRRMRETDRAIAFKPWIYEIAKNACIDEFRRSKRSREVLLEEGDGSGIVARNVYVHAPPPEAAVESKQRLDDLCGAFGGLSESHHRVLVLRELEGLSYSEIGERLGMTRAMVESTLFRARRRLSEEYEELTSGRRCARVLSLIDAGGDQRLTSLGVRERRQLARHLRHCQPCRRTARVGGVDESLLEPRRGLARLAALLPLPLLRWRRGGSAGGAVARSGSHSVSFMQSLPNVAQLIDPVGPSAALGRAAAAAAALAIAGAGGGLVAGLDTGTRVAVPVPVAPVSAGARLPVLSITKILAPAMATPFTATVVSPFAATAPSGAMGGPSEPQDEAAGGGPGGIAVGVAPIHSGGGGSGTPGSGATGGGGGTPPSGGTGGSGGSGGSSQGGTPSGSSGAPNNGIPVPQGVGASGPPSEGPPPNTPNPPNPPAPPTNGPIANGPGVPNDPTGAVQGVQAPSPSSVQSTVQNAPTTATQTASQVQQSAPSVPSTNAVSPPSGG